MKLSGIMIGSDNAKQLGEFYTQIFGKPMWQDGEWYGFEVGLMVGPHSEVKGQNSVPGRMIINFETTELQDDFERIKGLGAKVVAEPYKPGNDESNTWLATFADPDRNYFQLAT